MFISINRTKGESRHLFHIKVGDDRPSSIFNSTRSNLDAGAKHTHVQNPLAKKPTEKSEHFGHLACENTIPSFDVSKWKPTCFTFAFTLRPPIVWHLLNKEYDSHAWTGSDTYRTLAISQERGFMPTYLSFCLVYVFCTNWECISKHDFGGCKPNRKISRLDEGNVSSDHQPKYNPNSVINQLYYNL